MQEHLTNTMADFVLQSKNGTYAYFLTFEEGNQTHQISTYLDRNKVIPETQTVAPASELDPDVLDSVHHFNQEHSKKV